MRFRWFFFPAAIILLLVIFACARTGVIKGDAFP